MKLLSELTEYVDLQESVEGDKKYYYLEGIVMQSEIKNRNGRIYPKTIMENSLDKYMQLKMPTKTAYGEFGHPSNPSINPDRISHIFESLRWDGNNVIGRAKIFDTVPGLAVQKILEGGGKFGMSSRALGSLKESSAGLVVQSDFLITTPGDIVTDPSAPDAYQSSIMEATDWWLDNMGEWHRKIVEGHVKEVKNVSRAEKETVKFKIFEDFMRKLSKI